MSWRDPKLVFLTLSFGMVFWLVFRDLEHATSPGPLSRTHAQVADLEGASGCERCHGTRRRSMAAACGDCHEAVAVQLAAGRGLHGQLEEPEDCVRCHAEHHGPDTPLSGETSFARAGFEGRAAFDHALLGFTLVGRHAELECADCHRAADDQVLEPGTPRFLGLAQGCESCHEDVHEGRMRRACADCHGQEHPFAEVATFRHRTVSLDGAHAGLDCVACHEPGSAHSVEALGAIPETAPVPDERACDACHDSLHTDRFADAGCGACHAAEHDTFAGHADAMPIALHAASGFPLSVPHDEVSCAACHEGADVPRSEAVASPFQRETPRAAEDCAACHADPHAGQFEGQGCVTCHGGAHFAPSTFGLEDHARTGLPLEGSHAEVACAACHVPAGTEPPGHFRGLPTDCASCHANVHGERLSGPGSDDCATCHVATRFADVEIASFEHELRTSFALEGMHAEAECAACHPSRPAPDAGGRRFGLASERATGPVELCASCHVDVHLGAFATTADDCAACHDPHAFGGAREGFEHARTGFVLEGAHARASCEACHARSAVPDANHRSLGRVRELFGEPADACATCHADPHGGAFDRGEEIVDGRSGCARCHGTEAFRPVAREFDHERWTGYPLSQEHAALACVSCHAPGATEAGRRLGPAPGTSCADCHADPHVGQFARGEPARTDCSRCHADAGGLDFDHARDTRFALDVRHAALDCGACHRPSPLADGRLVVRYRPLGTTCADCHGPGPVGGGDR